MNVTLFGGVIGGAALLLAGLYLTYAYVPRRGSTALNASVVRDSLMLGGHARTFIAVIPGQLPPDAPILLVFHGSMDLLRKSREHTARLRSPVFTADLPGLRPPEVPRSPAASIDFGIPFGSG